MPDTKFIIKVTANFDEGNSLFSWLSKFGTNHDNRFVYWQQYAFTVDDVADCDGILVLNSPSKPFSSNTFFERVIALMMEPGISYEHPWMFKGMNQYYSVYSPIAASANTVRSHGFLGWYLPHTYPQLIQWQKPVKSQSFSCVVSGLNQLPGHQLRNQFVSRLKRDIPEMELYGRQHRFIKDKSEALLPFRYSLALENCSEPDYFTEKINDCFLTYTVPVYFGATNIEKYFPNNSFVSIDINKPDEAISQIRHLLETDDWEKRLPALEEARQLVLQKYHPLAGAVTAFEQSVLTGKKVCSIRPVTKSWHHKIVSNIKSKRAFKAKNA